MAEEKKIPGIVEQRVFASEKETEVESATNNFIAEATKKRWQITNISHLAWGEKLTVVISFLRPLKEEKSPSEIEIKEL